MKYWKGFTMRQILISSIFFSSLLLISCQQAQETASIKEQQIDTQEQVEASPIEMDEALEITWRIQNQLFDIFNFAYYYYGEDIEPMSTEVFQDMQKRLSSYVTPHFLEQELNTTIKQYCYAGCGVLFLPLGIHDKTAELTETSSDRFTISTSYEPSIYMPGGIQRLTYVLENDVWKMDARFFEKTDDQLVDVNVPLGDKHTHIAEINPIIDAFNERVLTALNSEEVETHQQYDAFLEELANEIRQIDQTFNDNQQVWADMRTYAVERELAANGPTSQLQLYEDMTVARIHSLISRYHTY